MSGITLAERAFLKEFPESVNRVAHAINRVADSLALVANAISGKPGGMGCMSARITVNGSPGNESVSGGALKKGGA